MKKILALGGSSYVGKHLVASLPPEHVLFTYNRSPIEGGVQFDAASMNLSDIVIRPDEFSHAVILLGETIPASCLKDPKKSDEVNVKGIERLLDQLKEWSIKPIFTSSEYVYDGEQGNSSETDEAKPILLYGKQKLEVERYLENSGVDSVVLRLAKIVGSECGDGSLFSNWLEAFDKTNSLMCARDQTFSPVYVKDVVQSILKAIQSDLRGTYNISCSVAYTRLSLLELLVKQIKEVNPNFTLDIETCNINDFDLSERSPIDVSMDSSKFSSDAQFQFTSMDVVCKRLVEAKYQTAKA